MNWVLAQLLTLACMASVREIVEIYRIRYNKSAKIFCTQSISGWGQTPLEFYILIFFLTNSIWFIVLCHWIERTVVQAHSLAWTCMASVPEIVEMYKIRHYKSAKIFCTQSISGWGQTPLEFFLLMFFPQRAVGLPDSLYYAVEFKELESKHNHWQ